MVNYSNSKIYKIQCRNKEGEIYIGSTTKQYLSQRMDNHHSAYRFWKKGGKTNKCKSFDIFDLYGVENCEIELIENFVCESKDQLRAREGYHIQSIKCVNKCIAGQTKKEYDDSRVDEKKLYDQNRRQETFICVCGVSYTCQNKARHLKSIKHQKFVNFVGLDV